MARREDPGEDLHTPTGRASKNGSRGRAQDMLREEESCPSCRRRYSKRRDRKPMVCAYDHVRCEECWGKQRKAGDRTYCSDCGHLVKVTDCRLIDTASDGSDDDAYRMVQKDDQIVFEDGLGNRVRRRVLVNPLVDLVLRWLAAIFKYFVLPASICLLIALAAGWRLTDLVQLGAWSTQVSGQIHAVFFSLVPGWLSALTSILPLLMVPLLSMVTTKAWLGGLSLALKGTHRTFQHNVLLVGLAVSSARAYSSGVLSSLAQSVTLLIWLAFWKFQVEADMVAPGARDRAIFNGPLSLLCPDHFIDWATGLWVTASGFAPIDLRFRVASLALCALIFWHEAVGPWVTSFSSQDPCHNNSRTYRDVYKYCAAAWLYLWVWQTANMPLASWWKGALAMAAGVGIVWNLIDRPTLQVWRGKREAKAREKDGYYRVESMQHRQAGDVVVAFSAIFAPHLPFPSSALFTLYCAIMAMAAYQLAGPLLTWLSVRPAWVDAKPRWAKFLPDVLWSTLSGAYFLATAPLQVFWYARRFRLDRFFLRALSLAFSAAMCFVATALTLMDEDKQYRILSAEVVVGGAHILFKDWVSMYHGSSFVVSLYSYSLVVGLVLDEARFHRFVLCMAVAALCWFGMGVSRVELLTHEANTVNRVLMGVAYLGPFLTDRALAVSFAVAVSSVFVLLLQRARPPAEVLEQQEAQKLAAALVKDIMGRLPMGLAKFRELTDAELSRIYRESEEDMRRYYERNPVFVDPAFAAQPRGRFSGAASVAGRASVGGRARSSYAASVGGSYAAARGGFYAQSAAGAGPSSEVARLREQVLRSQAMTMQAEAIVREQREELARLQEESPVRSQPASLAGSGRSQLLAMRRSGPRSTAPSRLAHDLDVSGSEGSEILEGSDEDDLDVTLVEEAPLLETEDIGEIAAGAADPGFAPDLLADDDRESSDSPF